MGFGALWGLVWVVDGGICWRLVAKVWVGLRLWGGCGRVLSGWWVGGVGVVCVWFVGLRFCYLVGLV